MAHRLPETSADTPLIRPRLIIETARLGARAYQRGRDLASALAMAGSAAVPASREIILARLSDAEMACEELRRERSPAYRPGRHVQVLSALLAEAAPDQVKASGSEALRAAT